LWDEVAIDNYSKIRKFSAHRASKRGKKDTTTRALSSEKSIPSETCKNKLINEHIQTQ
jgi:hypothetical protein